MKIIRYLFCLLCLLLGFSGIQVDAQVTIGVLDPPHESALLELKSENDDKGVLFPEVALKAVWDSLTIAKPAVGLMVFNTKDSDPEEVIIISNRVRANNFYIWSGIEWVELVGQPDMKDNIEIAFSKLGVPRPALYTLNGNTRLMPQDYPNMRGVVNLLKDAKVGDYVYLPMIEQVNLTDGTVSLISSKDATKVKLKPGVYDIKFGYEFVPATTAESGTGMPPVSCTVSSYFMDFPFQRIESDGSIRNLYGRIHSSSTHNPGQFSNHGSAINYITIIFEEVEWPVRLGRGQAGNCVGISGFAMPNRSTFLSIFRVGDIQVENIEKL